MTRRKCVSLLFLFREKRNWELIGYNMSLLIAFAFTVDLFRTAPYLIALSIFFLTTADSREELNWIMCDESIIAIKRILLS